MGNLLTLPMSFDWSNATIDRNAAIESLNDALLAANSYNDNIFKHPDLFFQAGPSIALFSLLWVSDFAAFKAKFPWIKEPQFQILVTVQNYFKKSPNDSRTLAELFAATAITPNAWIGLASVLPEPLVRDFQTWEDVHRADVSGLTRAQRLAKKADFLRFYIPSLTVDVNAINNMIRKNRVSNSFLRIDSPHVGPDGNIIHGEQIHIHFNDDNESALNIDGTWKHGECDLSNKVCESLVSWGFILPENR